MSALPRADGGPPGRGLVVGLLLLLVLEFGLHTDALLWRFRSVFAAGRAMDKVLFVETHCPHWLVLGNSRADNAFDPQTIGRALTVPGAGDGFNLGLPGADMRVLAGVVERLERRGCFADGGIREVVLSLDEGLLQAADTLGQDVFFASPQQLWRDGQYHDLLRTAVRLYGYADNIRQLREPAVLQRFVSAVRGPVDPVGGAAASHRGYRAGVAGFQDRQAALDQEAGSAAAPSAVDVAHLWRTLDRLAAHGVRVTIVFPPLLGRDVLYLTPGRVEAAPYLSIVRALRERGIAMVTLDAGQARDPQDFVNAGHLNDRGAQRYSRMLGEALNDLWRVAPAPAVVRGPGA